MDEAEIIEQLISESEGAAGVVVPLTWFRVDAYGAAVSGIRRSIRLGLESGSLGEGSEEATLRAVEDKLLELDPHIAP